MDLTTAILGHRIWVENDTLNVEGGAWAYLDLNSLPARIELTLGLVLMAELGEEIVLCEVQVGVAGPDGVLRDEMVSAAVAWPKPVAPVSGQPVVVPLAIPVPFDVMDEGRHTLVVFLEKSQTNRAAVPFAIRVRPASPS